MKAIIEDGCIACGLCEELCPQVFVMKDFAEVKPDADVDGNLEAAEQAAADCPVEVIKILK